MPRKKKSNNWCCVCGKELPQHFTVCKECSEISPLDFDEWVIYQGKDTVQCVVCKAEIDTYKRRRTTKPVCNNCERKYYQDKKKREKKLHGLTQVNQSFTSHTKAEDLSERLIDLYLDKD